MTLSARPVGPRLRVLLHDGFLEIASETEGVAVRYDERPVLIAVLQDIAADLVRRS